MYTAEKYGKTIKRCFGCCWAVFAVTLWKEKSQKLRRIIKLRFGLLRIRFYCSKDQTLQIPWVLDFCTLRTSYLLIWIYRTTLKTLGNMEHCWSYCFVSPWWGTISEVKSWNRFGLDGHRTMIKISLTNSWKRGIGYQYLPQKWMGICIIKQISQATFLISCLKLRHSLNSEICKSYYS